MARGGSAWDLAVAAAHRADVELVPVHGMDHAERIVRIVEDVWGPGDLSPAMARAFEHAGSVMFAAASPHRGGGFVGFVLGFAGLADGLHVHSHMLAVLPGHESRGVGYALKLAQRAASLDAGIDEVRWTFDPLVVRNGWFNLVKLGCTAERLLIGFYGEMKDQINRGDRTDRFEVVWRLRSDRVERALAGDPIRPSTRDALLEVGEDGRTPRRAEAWLPGPGAVVGVPLDHAGLRAGDPELGMEWRRASAEAFETCFGAGLVSTWVGRDGRYVFERVPASIPAEDIP
jgi:predicted GNAT superfamily acetyltransferase